MRKIMIKSTVHGGEVLALNECFALLSLAVHLSSPLFYVTSWCWDAVVVLQVTQYKIN